MVRVQSATVSQEKCRFLSAKMNWLDAYSIGIGSHVDGLLECDPAISDNARGVIHDTVYKLTMWAATANWIAAQSCQLGHK